MLRQSHRFFVRPKEEAANKQYTIVSKFQGMKGGAIPFLVNAPCHLLNQAIRILLRKNGGQCLAFSYRRFIIRE